MAGQLLPGFFPVGGSDPVVAHDLLEDGLDELAYRLLPVFPKNPYLSSFVSRV